jgi:5-carboxymethyl-2-hydroxymuconate isomerase
MRRLKVPQITLDYSQNMGKISFADLFAELHQCLAEVAGVPIENCKSRAICHEQVVIGRGEAANAFAHLTIGFYSGRSPELKQEIGQRALALMQAYLAPTPVTPALQITVELREFQPADYFRFSTAG